MLNQNELLLTIFSFVSYMSIQNGNLDSVVKFVLRFVRLVLVNLGNSMLLCRVLAVGRFVSVLNSNSQSKSRGNTY